MNSIVQNATTTLSLVVRQITLQAQGINSYELVDPAGKALPVFTAGAHLDLHLSNGLIRQYSLSNAPTDRYRYVIGVLKDPNGSGGSAAVHQLTVGDVVEVSVPRNNFKLAAHARKVILLAGGIGVTPMKAMLHELELSAIEYELYYCCKGPEFAAFKDEFEPRASAGNVHLHFDGGDPRNGLNITALLEEAQDSCHVYYCGPGGFMEACRKAAAHWPAGTVHFEHFKAPTPVSTPVSADAVEGFVAQIASTGQQLFVRPEQNLAQVLQDAGLPLETSCQSGLCGTCKVRYLSGDVDHQDYILDDSEKAEYLTACVSKAKGGVLVLDL
ncbi:PDR/VanB family oxidoreductase [Pseudomonas sp. ANT_H12B]|uniref:PDR/VanB family oxidoreductase n=1 Tax=Pseudomonas sp. ANT_H12B TaxID=2597348 RepID=UPI0011EBB1A8|nr:PDR/VanB family oxidoreductase [Pseudomonas sp. ANT_H12B]KAA0980412.1 oxidoreductase [Pseudomonas sp. ANT_H12B]